MAALATLISWWRTPKVPSEAQRVETLNSFRHKDVAIPMADVTGLNTALNNKASTAALNAIYDGVDAAGNTLKKLYNLVLGAIDEVTVADRAARDAYNAKLGEHVFVTDDGDGNWALYKALSAGAEADYVLLSDPDLLNAVMSASQIKTAYESNSDTNAFTNALKSKLESLGVDYTVEGNWGSNFSINIPAKKMLRDVVIMPTAVAQTIRIGTSSGGSEVWDDTLIPIAGGADNPFGFNKWFNTARTLYISGVTADTYFKFFIQ